MLPFDIQVGTTYRDDFGNEFTILFSDHETDVFIGRMGKTQCFGVFNADGSPATGSLLAGLVMPAETWGVYHVSDGDTPLKAALERWWKAGGDVEHRFSDTGWGQSGESHKLCDKSSLYRAAGCTEDREFPQPKPKMPDRVWRSKDGDSSLLQELIAWHESGGGIETSADGPDKWWWLNSTPNWEPGCCYRAVGCTAEPAIDQPQPPAPQPEPLDNPVTMRDMADYIEFLRRDGSFGPSLKECAEWWQQRAQQDSRP